VSAWVIPSNYFERKHLAELAGKQMVAFERGDFQMAQMICDQMDAILTGR